MRFCGVMRRLFFISIFITSLATVILYQPVSDAIYRIKEPYFKCPIKIDKGKVVIRKDLKGGGEFGAKRNGRRQHSGIDVLAPQGAPVHASKSGIAFCGNIPTGYGKYVMVYHRDGFQTIYGHLSNWNVRSTEKVRQGEIIGFVGKTGNAAHRSIQSHLHFEIRKYGEPQNPQNLMR